jgi:hypothetical protein
MELVWRGALDDDPAIAFLLAHVTAIARSGAA